jgi:pSer/pThr/pTyr-binding forkhead associated (FHA) protein
LKIYASVVDTKGKKQTFALREKPIIIGRSSKAHITISDDLTSGAHCHINILDNCVFVTDINSKNGIFLNEIKVSKQRIYLDDKVSLGNTVLYLDPKKMDKEAISLLKPTSKRISGDVTLEIQTFKEGRTKNSSKKSLDGNKLYSGVEDSNKQLNKASRSKFKIIFMEYLSLSIDLFLNILFIALPFVIFKKLLPRDFIKCYPKNEISLETLSSGNGLYFAIACMVISFVFYKWNRGNKKGSIGERILGLD